MLFESFFLYPNLELESQEILDCCQFSVYIGIPKKYVLTPEKEWLRDRMDELASEMRTSEQKQKFPSPLVFCVGCHWKVASVLRCLDF